MKAKVIFSFLGKSVVYLLNIGAILWLLLCKLASYADPSRFSSFLSLFSFSALFACIANVAFILFWLFTKRKIRALYSTAALLICWNVFQSVLGIHFFSNSNPKVENGLKVMTWNVHMFDLGGWTKDKTSKNRIIELIKLENPDILCLQEFYWDLRDKKEPFTEALQQLGYNFIEFAKENEMFKSHITSNAQKGDIIQVGHAIFSKFPLQNKQSYSLDNNKYYTMLSVDAQINTNTTINVNVLHLTSVGFDDKELNYIDDVKNKGVNAQQESQSKNLLNKLRKAATNRAILANRIDSLKRHIDKPMIICGDFNDVPSSYTYTKVKGKLTDAFVSKGSGLGRTYTKIAPTLRIDYILYDASILKAASYHAIDVNLSDHLPVIVNFSINDNR